MRCPVLAPGPQRRHAGSVGRAINYAEAEHLRLGYDAVLGILINGFLDSAKFKGESAEDAERELNRRVPPKRGVRQCDLSSQLLRAVYDHKARARTCYRLGPLVHAIGYEVFALHILESASLELLSPPRELRHMSP